MDPVSLTVSPLPVIAFVTGLVIGWFAGGYYKSKRVQGMTKDEIKVLTEEKLKAYVAYLASKIDKLKDGNTPPT